MCALDHRVRNQVLRQEDSGSELDCATRFGGVAHSSDRQLRELMTHQLAFADT
jgi:hypothetical protein